MGIEVRPATGRWDDFASFMVPRKPAGGGCVCMVYRNSSLDMPGRIAHMRALCQSAPGPGVLAYVDVGVTQVAADLGLVLFRWREEVGASRAPLRIHGSLVAGRDRLG